MLSISVATDNNEYRGVVNYRTRTEAESPCNPPRHRPHTIVNYIIEIVIMSATAKDMILGTYTLKSVTTVRPQERDYKTCNNYESIDISWPITVTSDNMNEIRNFPKLLAKTFLYCVDNIPDFSGTCNEAIGAEIHRVLRESKIFKEFRDIVENR